MYARVLVCMIFGMIQCRADVCMDVWYAYLWVFENEFGRKISVQDAVEDDWHTQCEVEGGVDPRVVQRSTRHCSEIAEMQNGFVM